jgi:hypothetical protein
LKRTTSIHTYIPPPLKRQKKSREMTVIAPVKHERAALPDETQRPTSPTIDLGLDLAALACPPPAWSG